MEVMTVSLQSDGQNSAPLIQSSCLVSFFFPPTPHPPIPVHSRSIYLNFNIIKGTHRPTNKPTDRPTDQTINQILSLLKPTSPHESKFNQHIASANPFQNPPNYTAQAERFQRRLFVYIPFRVPIGRSIAFSRAELS